MSANIRLNGSPTPLTVTAGTPVTLSNFDNTGVAGWLWELLDKPEGSASGVASPNSASTTSTPDLSGGSYLIRLTTYKDALRTQIDDVDQAIILVNFTSVPVDPLPAAGETREADPTLGWKSRVNRFLKYVHDHLATVLSGPLGQSLLGTGAASAFGIPQTSTTVTGVASYAALDTDRLIVMTNVGAAAVNLNNTAPPAGFSKVLRIVNAGPTSIAIKDPSSVTIYTIPGFAGAYVDVGTSNGTVWTVMYPSLASSKLFGPDDTSGDLAVRGASTWGRFSAGAEGFSLLTASGAPAWDIPLTYMTLAVAGGTISAQTRLVLYAGGADAILTMPSTAPPSPFARTVRIVNTTSHIVTVKDPGGNVIGILDGSVVLVADFGTPDGTLWGTFSENQPLPADACSDLALFTLAASTSVGDVVDVTNFSGNRPTIARRNATAIDVQTNPLYVVLKTQDGSAAAVGVDAFVIKRGIVRNYNVAGSPVGGAAVYVSDTGVLSTAHGTFTRRVGTILSGSGASWNVWFDGTSQLVWQGLAVIDDPPAGSTTDLSCDNTATPRTDYYMAPGANHQFDPTTAIVSQRITITKTNTNAFKITLPAVVGWKYYPTGATNTAFDLPGSNINSDSAYHQWTLTIDVPNKIVYVSPSA